MAKKKKGGSKKRSLKDLAASKARSVKGGVINGGVTTRTLKLK